jgi:DNA adenine methylase
MIVPPLKCQGIKTKIVPAITACVSTTIDGTWIEPFCGSCVVALNVQPQRALLADSNTHLINLYRDIQSGAVSPNVVRSFLEHEGEALSRGGDDYYYHVRDRFNDTGSSLDFLFLNRSCFNGVIRFNRYGKFNVPFGHKPDRFRLAYVTKIVNQVTAFRDVLSSRDWHFEVADFRSTLSRASADDFIYVDPPYQGRHVDYYSSWTEHDERDLVGALKNTPARFLLSTWHSNRYRSNPSIAEHWQDSRFFVKTQEHFYHVGSTENLRNAMLEALIGNYELPAQNVLRAQSREQIKLFED